MRSNCKRSERSEKKTTLFTIVQALERLSFGNYIDNTFALHKLRAKIKTRLSKIPAHQLQVNPFLSSQRQFALLPEHLCLGRNGCPCGVLRMASPLVPVAPFGPRLSRIDFNILPCFPMMAPAQWAGTRSLICCSAGIALCLLASNPNWQLWHLTWYPGFGPCIPIHLYFAYWFASLYHHILQWSYLSFRFL